MAEYKLVIGDLVQVFFQGCACILHSYRFSRKSFSLSPALYAMASRNFLSGSVSQKASSSGVVKRISARRIAQMLYTMAFGRSVFLACRNASSGLVAFTLPA